MEKRCVGREFFFSILFQFFTLASRYWLVLDHAGTQHRASWILWWVLTWARASWTHYGTACPGPPNISRFVCLSLKRDTTLDSCGRPSQYVSNIICSKVFRRIPRDTDSLATERGCGSQAVSDFTMVSRLGYCHLPCLALPLVKKRGIHFIKPDPAFGVGRTPRRGHKLPLNTQTVSWAIRTQGTTLLRNLVGHTSRYSLDSGPDTIIIFAQNVRRLKPATTVR